MQLQTTIKISGTGITDISEAPIIPVEAIDIINVAVPYGTADLEVEIKPAGTGNVLFLAILASAYPITTEEANLSYKIHEAISDAVPMKNIHLYSDKGQIDAMTLDFDKLFFSNDHASQDVTVKVLVGRDATPTP